MFSWLAEAGLLDDDPWAGLRVSMGRSRRLPRAVPDAALDAFLATLRTRAGMTDVDDVAFVDRRPHETTTLLAVVLMVATGVRVNELVNIGCAEIDLVRGTIRIPAGREAASDRCT